MSAEPSLNRLALSLGPSPTMQGAASPCRHPDPVDLTVGEPAAAPPEAVREAAGAAAREDRARYGPAAGLPELRARVAEDLNHRDGLSRSPEQVILTSGGKAALLDALRCLLEPGDEVIVFAPHWPTFLDQIRWAGGVPRVVPCGADLLPEGDALEAAVNPHTRAVILNQPSNPTGRVWDEARLLALARLAREHALWILVDQVYGTLSLDGPERPFLRQVPDLTDRTVVVESFSKRFAMTGYRLGAAAGPLPLIRAMTALASSSVTHPNVLAQHAGLAALGLDDRWERAQLQALREQRDEAVASLSRLPGLRLQVPEGGLFLFPDCQALLEGAGLADDQALVASLRDELGLKLLPGSAFGAPGHVRLSLGAPRDRLREGIGRLASFWKRVAA